MRSPPRCSPDVGLVIVSKDPPAADQLVRLALSMFDLGVSTDGEPFGIIKDGPRVVHLLRGSKDSLRTLRAREFWVAKQKAATSSAIADAMLTVEGIARDSDPVELHLRVAGQDDEVWLDLGDSTGRAVKVTSDGWWVDPRSPVLFKRTALTAALPTPVQGDLGDLRRFLNVDDESWGQIAGWLVASLFPGIPHAILAMTGEQGSANQRPLVCSSR